MINNMHYKTDVFNKIKKIKEYRFYNYEFIEKFHEFFKNKLFMIYDPDIMINDINYFLKEKYPKINFKVYFIENTVYIENNDNNIKINFKI